MPSAIAPTGATDRPPVSTPVGATAPPTPTSSRELLTAEFWAEYRALRARAAGAPEGATARTLRLRAWAWKTTAQRMTRVADARWPTWLLRKLRGLESLRVLGPEYRRQRLLVADRCSAGGAETGGAGDGGPADR